MMMNSGCKSSAGCVEARAPVRANYLNLYKWPESDAEFVKSVARRARNDHCSNRRPASSAPVVDSYSCRQMYLRSYTFSKKESFPEKTKRRLGKVRETAAFLNRSRSTDSSAGSFRSNASADGNNVRTGGSTGSRKKRKKTCGTARTLRKFSCSALRSIFHRLLSCTAGVDVVVDRGHKR